MKLTNTQRNLRLKKLLLIVGLPVLIIVAFVAATHGKGFILFMILSLGVFWLGIKLVKPLAQSKFKSRNVVAFVAVLWLTISCAVSFALVEVLSVGV